MTILVDIDSTITNFAEVLLDYLNDSERTSYRYSEIISYDWFEKTFHNPWQPTEERYFWDEIKVFSQAVYTLESWVKSGNKVYFVTASHFNNTFDYKIRNTLSYFNPKLINESNVIVTQHKNMIKGDILIDDCLDNLNHFDGLCICYAQPWNAKCGNLYRTDNWNVINDIVLEIKKQRTNNME